MNKRKLGALHEEAAAHFLSAHGVQIVQKNFRVRQGEIDLIGWDEGVLIFVEVKYRADLEHGTPAEAVNGKKQEKIRRTAACYLQWNRLPSDVRMRFDVVEILKVNGQKHYLRWIRNAF